MQLNDLPNELLALIIDETLPEGFESLATTSKQLHALCLPFIKTHNTLRAQHGSFDYMAKPGHEKEACAWDLIMSIALEPRTARYIRHADFTWDSHLTQLKVSPLYDDDAAWGPGLALLARSPCLAEAGLDHEDYAEEIRSRLARRYRDRYCQHASTFLLSLLPNLRTLALPRQWRLCDDTARLLDVIMRRAGAGGSLAQVSNLECPTWAGATYIRRQPYPAITPAPFFALPKLRRFEATRCASADAAAATTTSIPRAPSITALTTSGLEDLTFKISEIDLADFTALVQSAPRLKTLRYHHVRSGWSDASNVWDLPGLLTMLAATAGSRLEALSIHRDRGHGQRAQIAPGTACMRGFRVLHTLELDLGLVEAGMAAQAAEANMHTRPPPTTTELTSDRTSILGQMVPLSVSRLSLVVYHTGNSYCRVPALDAISEDLEMHGTWQVPNLTHIYVTGQQGEPYRSYCSECKISRARLRKATEKAGIQLCLEDGRNRKAFEWAEVEYPSRLI